MRRYRIGRSDTSDIVIPDASVSRQHAELVELGAGRFSLTDLGSTFGTHVRQGDTWVPAAGTEIASDTAIRFGQFQTTVADILKPAGQPTPQSPPPAAAQSAAAERPSAMRTPPAPAAAPAPRRRAPARPRRSAPERQRLAMRLGLAAVGGFFVLAIAGVIVVLTLGDANAPRRAPDPSAEAGGEAQRRFLAACTNQWSIEERRCRCFLAAAGPTLQREDYDDFAAIVEAYLSGDSARSESVLGRVAEKRGPHASTRLTAAFKSVVRDCQQ